ncbi:Trk system potassium uptake protein TrkA [Halomonas chromatireducens]|uniref:Trk system potassium uptake protein TrkA n=1 Tax=Halomonas chromatireducens TaxID=507626 RepID=A0A125R0A6_9GAMM|nr:Trk system potassium uptake protein TrkA [Halomonas chromatireducens]
MKIIILGAGQVGGTLAEHLAREENDITVVDTDGERLRELHTRLDIRTVVGPGSYPVVLRQAGCEDAKSSSSVSMAAMSASTPSSSRLICRTLSFSLRLPKA